VQLLSRKQKAESLFDLLTQKTKTMKKQIIKTEEFFVENRDDKQSRILRIKDQMPELFMNIAFKENRRDEQRDSRREKRNQHRTIRRHKQLEQLAEKVKNEGFSETDFRELAAPFIEHQEYIDELCIKYFAGKNE
jgi:hypothetical protein